MSDPTQRPISRRAFLGITAGAAGVAAGCSPKAATQKVIPWLVPPEDLVPGLPLYYRTVCRGCGAGCGVTARTREGRAVKLEGNPEDPIGAGALCARGQATIQALYHPERFRGPMQRGPDGRPAPVGWDAAEDALVQAIAAARAKGPGRVRLLTRAEPGSLGALQRALLAGIGGRAEDRVVLEPLDPGPIRAASQALFGRAELPVLDLSGARTVVAFGADLFETWGAPVEAARQLASGRGRVGAARTRVTWVGPRLALTGLTADRWVRARSGGELPFALAVLRWLVDPANAVPGLGPDAAALSRALAPLPPAELAARAGVAEAEVARVARELARRRPSALVGPGPSAQGADATRLAAVVLLANHVLGNVGKTVLYGLDPLLDPPSPFAAVEGLLRDAAAGAIDVLLVHHADPVGALPAALGAAAALDRVPLVVAFALRPDATTAHARLVLADDHALEAFGDVVPRKGVVNLGQPAMTPLFDTRSAAQVLLELGGKLPAATPPLPSGDVADWHDDRVKAYLADAGLTAADPAAALRDARQRGGIWSDASGARATPALRPGAAVPFLALPPAPAGGAGDLDLVVAPAAVRGAGSDLPWLREVPDPVTTLSWTAWAELSPGTAARLRVSTGDLVAVATEAGRAEVPAYVYPGLRDDAVALPLGAEAWALLPIARDAGSGALALASARATVRAIGRHPALPILEGSPYQHGREIVKAVSAAAPALAHADLSEQMYAGPKHPDHRWGMAIDLDRCTGCSACVVACFAENNVPVMGPQAASEGRYMGWLRVERYLGEEPGAELDPRLVLMLCQHCTNAPCEPVCPVYATYHTAEGLNAQVYNRCVGTRYCNNNCPYKVRVFNWRDPKFPEPLNQQLNPDVTVRSRGVMEKCTFCVQRIRYAEDQARLAGRKVEDGEVVPACAQTCAARAIVFGDLNDPASRVSRLSRDPRGFRALEEVNTQPAITYLAHVREPEEP